jgi:hypothetical protein
MSRNRWIILAVLGLVNLLVYCGVGAILLLGGGGAFPIQIGRPAQPTVRPSESPLVLHTPTPTLSLASSPVPAADVTGASVRMDGWEIRLIDVYTGPAPEPGTQHIDMVVDVTNLGEGRSTFSAFPMLLHDAEGRAYYANIGEGWRCIEMYGVQRAVLMESDVTVRTCISYVVPQEARSFTTSPSSTVNVWSGGLSFELL